MNWESFSREGRWAEMIKNLHEILKDIIKICFKCLDTGDYEGDIENRGMSSYNWEDGGRTLQKEKEGTGIKNTKDI